MFHKFWEAFFSWSYESGLSVSAYPGHKISLFSF